MTAAVRNLGSVPLGDDNLATVNALVVERVRVNHTGRFVRGAGQMDIVVDVPPGHVEAYTIVIPTVPVEDWSRVFVVVLVDYQPEAGSTRYEALQAHIARPDQGPLLACRLLLPAAVTGR